MRYEHTENNLFADRVLTLASVQPLASEIVELRFQTDKNLDVLPGHFVHLSVGGFSLRRPISVADYSPRDGRLTLIVQDVGAGTRALASLAPGTPLRALFPLGRPFPMPSILDGMRGGKKTWIVAGGIGLAPMLFCSRLIREAGFSVTSFVGFRDSEHAFGLELLKRCGPTVPAVGGFVTDSLLSALRDNRPDLILACGPTPLLRVLREICVEHKIAALASLEERMGCGVGACLVCNCKVRVGTNFDYRRVCKDGPVFDLAEVNFE